MEPTLSPIGVIELSTPTLKSSIPAISINAPIRKVTRILGGIGAIVKQSTNTIARIGNTASSVSVNFSENLER